MPLSGLRMAAPAEPRQIFQAGADYRSHVAEIIVSGREPGDTRSDDELRRVAEALMDERARTGTPFFFSGLPAAMCGPADDVLLPPEAAQVDWEAELAVVIGATAHLPADRPVPGARRPGRPGNSARYVRTGGCMSPLSADVHAHALVPAAEALVADRPELAQARAEEARGAGPRSAEVNREQIGQLMPALTDPQVGLAAMDAAGIDVQLVSPMPIHHYWADTDLAARYASAVNAGILDHCAAAPGRLIGLGTAPLQHPGLAAEVLSRAVGDGLRGVEVATYVAGVELADPPLEPFWSTAAELDAVGNAPTLPGALPALLPDNERTGA